MLGNEGGNVEGVTVGPGTDGSADGMRQEAEDM